MSNNNQPPNWGNNPPGAGGQWQGQQNPGSGQAPQGPTGPQAPHPGPPQQGWGPGPGQQPHQGQQQGYPQQPHQGYQPQPQQGYQPQPHQGYQPQPQQGGGPQTGTQQVEPEKRKSKAPIIIAGALALVLIAGGIVFAMNFLRGSSPAAAEGIPADALGVMEFNLNPSVADKLAVKDFAGKFPALADDVSDIDGDYKKALYLAISDGQEDAPDYSEIEPWLGDSVAVAAIKSAEGTDDAFSSGPDMMVVIQVTDRGKAEAFVAEHAETAQVAFMDDLMLMTEEGTPAPDVDGIRNAPLADSEDYKADMAKLDGSWLATGWVGNELIQQYVTETTMGSGLTPEVPNGRAAIGMKVEDGSAVMRAVSWSDQDVEKSAATSLLGTLPSASLGAMSFSLSDSVHDLLWEQMEPMVSENPAEAAELGIQSQDDLKAILGSEIAVSVDMDENSSPVVGVKVRTDDPAKHESFLELLGSELGAQGLEHVTDGDVVTTTFGQSASAFADPAEKLSDNETASKLTEGNGDPQAVVWVDVPAILAIPELGPDESDEMVQNLKPLSGVGVSSSLLDGDYAETFVRVGTK